MNIPFDVKKGLIVFGVGGLIYWLLRPGHNRKPLLKKEMDPAELKKNANIVQDAYIMAVKNKEPASVLEELNRETEKRYGLRVYKKADGKYYVKDTSGNDIKTS